MTQRIAGYCTLCRSRCGTLTVIDEGRMLAVEPLAGHPTGGALCAKGRAAPEMVHSPKRLTHPMRRISPKGAPDPQWQEISWDEALDEVARKLGHHRQAHGAESVAFAITTPSGTPMVDSNEWVERFVRLFGSPNIVYAVEICGWHKDYAHALTFGRGIGFPDYDRAETIVLWGHNPARTWLAQASRIAEARAGGAKVAVIDPKPEGSGQLADLWLRIRPGSDGALALAATRHLIESGRFDRDFVTAWTNAPILVDQASGQLLRASDLSGDPAEAAYYVVMGADGRPRAYDTRHPLTGEVRLEVEEPLTRHDGRQIEAASAFTLLRRATAPYDIAHTAGLTWLPEAQIAAFVALFEGKPRLAYHSWTGVGQHSNATAIERAIATLYALTGACDREGGNLWPLPLPVNAVNGLDLLPKGQRDKALGLERIPLGPPQLGWVTARDFARAVLEHKPYPVRALMSWGTNFVASQADAARNRAVLATLDYHVHVDMFLNETGEMADLVLPANMPWERAALKIGFEITQEAVETVQYRPAMLAPLGQSRADYEIAFDLAKRLGHGAEFFDGDITKGWDHQLAPLGVTLEDVAPHPKGLRLPQDFGPKKYARLQDGTVAGFKTPSRRVEIYSETLLAHGHAPLPQHVEPSESPLRPEADPRFPLVLTTAKTGWFIHTSHRHVASLRKKSPDPLVEVHSELAAARGINDGDWVKVTTPQGAARLKLRVNDALDPRVVLGEFGAWQGCEALGLERLDEGHHGGNLNRVLRDSDSDPISGSVPLRATSCQISPLPQENLGRWQGLRRFRLVAREATSDDVVALSFAPCDGGALPDYRAGQHVELHLDGGTDHRAYSLTGSCLRPQTLSLGIRAQGPEGALSRRIHALPLGHEVSLSAPSGVFTLPLSGTRPLVFLATGIGITPFLSQLQTIAATGAEGPETHLHYGVRNRRQHPFSTELARLKRELAHLQVTTFYSSPEAGDLQGRDYDRQGRLSVAGLAPLLPRRPLFYLCGSPDFVADTKAALVALGAFAFDIFAEAFTSPVTPPATLAPQEITLAGSGTRFLWHPEAGSILTAARMAGVTLPSGCSVGQCESCAMTVVAGEVMHLSPTEQEPNRCLTCIAVPLGPITLAP